ncbi:MAG: hypothetical protein ACRCXZ_09375 [Patescibacteria group bacterium]
MELTKRVNCVNIYISVLSNPTFFTNRQMKNLNRMDVHGQGFSGLADVEVPAPPTNGETQQPTTDDNQGGTGAA